MKNKSKQRKEEDETNEGGEDKVDGDGASKGK